MLIRRYNITVLSDEGVFLVSVSVSSFRDWPLVKDSEDSE